MQEVVGQTVVAEAPRAQPVGDHLVSLHLGRDEGTVALARGARRFFGDGRSLLLVRRLTQEARVDLLAVLAKGLGRLVLAPGVHFERRFEQAARLRPRHRHARHLLAAQFLHRLAQKLLARHRLGQGEVLDALAPELEREEVAAHQL